MNVATRDSARIVLARFEAEAEKLSAEEAAAALNAYEFNVLFDVVDGAYIVSHDWTLKGLRHVLARERFFESVTCNTELAS